MGTKICNNCHRELPLELFTYNGKTETYWDNCKECIRAKKRKTCADNRAKNAIEKNPTLNPDLEGFESRQLILELRARGYRGELIYYEEHKVVI